MRCTDAVPPPPQRGLSAKALQEDKAVVCTARALWVVLWVVLRVCCGCAVLTVVPEYELPRHPESGMLQVDFGPAGPERIVKHMPDPGRVNVIAQPCSAVRGCMRQQSTGRLVGWLSVDVSIHASTIAVTSAHTQIVAPAYTYIPPRICSRTLLGALACCPLSVLTCAPPMTSSRTSNDSNNPSFK